MRKNDQERWEDYLEAILNIVSEKNYAQVKDIASELEIGPSSVTEMMKKLSEAGYVNYRKYGAVTLTASGERLARRTLSKHNVLKDFLLILGVPDDDADNEACRIEHIVGDFTIDRIRKFLEFVSMEEGDPRWFEHFKYYCETGEYVRCDPGNEAHCPIHGNKKKAR